MENEDGSMSESMSVHFDIHLSRTWNDNERTCMLEELARLTNELPDGYLSTPQCHEHVIFLLCVYVCLFINIWFGKETLVISIVNCRFTDRDD